MERPHKSPIPASLLHMRKQDRKTKPLGELRDRLAIASDSSFPGIARHFLGQGHCIPGQALTQP